MNRLKSFTKNSQLVLFFIVLLLCSVYILFFSSSYLTKIMNTALCYCMIAFGLQLMLGMGGQMVFSGISFFGIGAYVAANLRTDRLGITQAPDGLVTILIAVVIVGIISFLLGLVFMKLKGVFCVFATVGLVSICFSLFSFFEPLFGLPDGISQIARITLFGSEPIKDSKTWYLILVVFVTIVALINNRIANSQFGRSLSAVRDDEIAAQTLGVNIYWTRVWGFVVGACYAGAAGALFAMHQTFVVAGMFTADKGNMILVGTVLGGMLSTPGILLGSILVTFLPELLRDVSSGLIMLIFGVLVIVLMIFMPMGLGGLYDEAVKKLRKRRKAKAFQAASVSDPGKENA